MVKLNDALSAPSVKFDTAFVNAVSSETIGAAFANVLLPVATLSSSLFSSRSDGENSAAMTIGAPEAGNAMTPDLK